MPSYARRILGLTQERVAAWVGTSRVAVAQAEAGTRNLPLGKGVQEARLTLAAQGLVYDGHGGSLAAPPPLPPPALAPEPLARRLDDCQHELHNLRWKLKALLAKAAQHEARLAALPALRAYPGPIANATREAGWLALLEGEAQDALRDECGAGPQLLLSARIAGLEREAEALVAALG